MFGWWGAAVVRCRWIVLAAGLVLAVVGVGWGAGIFGALTGGGFDDPASESFRAREQITATFGEQGADLLVLYSSDRLNVDDPPFRSAVTGTLEEIRRQPGVIAVTSWYDQEVPELVANDRHATYALIKLHPGGQGEKIEIFERLRPHLTAPGVRTEVGGVVAFQQAANEQTTEDITRAELLSMPVLLVLLVVIFGGLVAAGTPLLIGGLAILGGFVAVRLIDMVTEVSIFAINIITLIGLSMAIDYSLFVVSRFREELAAGHDTATAVARTMATAGRTVLVSGLTIAIALASLLIFPQPFLRSMGLGGMSAVLVAMLAALTVLPALLAVLGPRINALRVPRPWRWWRRRRAAVTGERGAAVVSGDLVPAGRDLVPIGRDVVPVSRDLVPIGRNAVPVSRDLVAISAGTGGGAGTGTAVSTSGSAGTGTAAVAGGDGHAATGAWARIAGSVMRRPMGYALGALTVLAVLAVPFFRIDFGGFDERVLPADTQVRLVSERIAEDFPGGTVAPVDVFISGAPVGQIQQFAQEASQITGVTGVTLVANSDDRSLLSVSYRGESTGATAESVVREIRRLSPPGAAEVLVGGRTAGDVDLLDSLGDRLVLMAVIMSLATLVLLFLAFGSVLLPVKAVLVNLVSIGASFGVVVWVFQDGHLADWLGFTPTGFIEPTSPILMLAVLFGLATDYEVFLLSRVREEWDRTGDNTLSVANGLQRTGRIITAAALLLIVVVAGFATGGIVLIKIIGVGMIVAVILDATLVRVLLVPATMRLLGRWNWWAPGPLERFWRRWGIRESSPVSAPPARSEVFIG